VRSLALVGDWSGFESSYDDFIEALDQVPANSVI